MVDPQIMCQKHILGEHVECHMIVGALNKGQNLNTEKWRRVIDPTQVQERHDALVVEMTIRGMNHRSPLPQIEAELTEGEIDVEESLTNLLGRCEKCRKLYMEVGNVTV